MFKGTKTVGTKDAAKDAALNAAQDRVQAEIRKELDILREKQRRGEIADMMSPKVRTPRLEKLMAEFDGLVKEQRALIVKDELDKLYKQEGARGLNANTSTDRTYYHIDIPSNKLELWAWLESDRLKNAVFREFYSERDVVLEERRQRYDTNPQAKALQVMDATVWQAHPYAWPVIGWVSDISQVTREQADAFFATYYAPNNITTVLVGDFKADEALPLLERYFGRIPANPKGTPALITQEPPQTAEQRLNTEIEAMPMSVAVYKTVPSVHKDSYALTMLGAILNGNSGRLNKELVLKQKIAVGAQAFNRAMKYGGMFYLLGVPTPEKTPSDMEAPLVAELEKIAKDGPTDQELQKVKNQFQAAAYGRMEDNGDLRDALAEADSAGTYEDFLKEPARLAAITKEDIRRVAAEYFKKENRTVLNISRKAVKQEGPVDPELEKIPAEARPMIQAQLKQLEGLDLEKCKAALAQMEGQVANVPPQAKPIFDYLLNKLRARIQKLEAK